MKKNLLVLLIMVMAGLGIYNTCVLTDKEIVYEYVKAGGNNYAKIEDVRISNVEILESDDPEHIHYYIPGCNALGSVDRDYAIKFINNN